MAWVGPSSAPAKPARAQPTTNVVARMNATRMPRPRARSWLAWTIRTASPSTTIIRIPTAVRTSKSNVTISSSSCPSSSRSVRAGQLRLDRVRLLLDGEGAVRLRLGQVLGLEGERVLDLEGPDRPVDLRALQGLDHARAVGPGLLDRLGEGL